MAFGAGSLIRDIMANEEAKAVVEKHLPGASTHPDLPEAMDMTLREISYYPESGLTPEKLSALVADLEKL